jgi:hypothetical protein
LRLELKHNLLLNSSAMIGKNIQLELIKLTESYLAGQYSEGIEIFAELHNLVVDADLTVGEAENMRKLFMLFMLGQLVELETMRQICVSCGITNSQHQVCYTALCSKLSQPQLFAFFEEAFQKALKAKLAPMLLKHGSNFSRDLVTLAMDDSVFKRCFSYSKEQDEEFDRYFGCFFSGQFGKAVWGFQVLTFGAIVSNVFYPLFLYCVPKTVKESAVKKSEKAAKKQHFITKKNEITALRNEIKAKKATEMTKEEKDDLKKENSRLKTLEKELKEQKDAQKVVKKPNSVSKKIGLAIKLVEKWGVFIKKILPVGRKIPNFHLSCDSGYSDINLSNACTALNIVYISVPKMGQCIQIGEAKKQQIKDYIRVQYTKLETAHKLKEAALSKDKKTPFALRIRARLCTQNRILTFLFFRLNGSRNVSAIYCTDPNIKAKTLRHHWFARTYIEQFFKLLKHYLRIQNAKTVSLHDFNNKLFRFAFIALHCQLLLQFIHKKSKAFKKQGLGTLRVILRSDPTIYQLLNQTINAPFAA